MHAASVHPEPGSNSRKICINTTHTGCTYLFPSLFCSYLLVRVSSSKEFRDSYFSHLHCFVLISVVQFSRIYAASLPRPGVSLDPSGPFPCDLYILPLPPPFVKSFSKVFSTFFALSKLRFHSSLPPFRDSFIRLPHPLPFVNPFFKSFFLFSRKDPKGQLRAELIGRIWKNIAGTLRQYYSKTGRNL